MSAPPPAGGAETGVISGSWAVRAAIIFLALTTAGVLVRIFRGILAPLVVAALLLLLIDGLARDLDKRLPRVPRLARGLAAGALIVAGFAAVILLLVFRAPPFALELTAIEPHVNVALARATGLIGQQPITVREMFHGADPSTLARAFRAARSTVTFAGLTMLYLGFLIASRTAFAAKLDRLFATARSRTRAERVIGQVRNAVEQYVRLVTLKALLVAAIAFGVMTVLAVPSALFVSFIVFLAAFVPIVGAFLGALVPALVALAQLDDLGRAVLIFVGLGVCVLAIDNLVMPKLQGETLNIDPLLVLISIGFWALLLGPTGALLSTPLTVTVMAIAAEFDGARWLAVLISRDGEPIDEIR